jgi:hypothetical protein
MGVCVSRVAALELHQEDATTLAQRLSALEARLQEETALLRANQLQTTVLLTERINSAVPSVPPPAERKKPRLTINLECPISLTRMVDPVVAADGYTYDRASIEEWFQRSDTSPMTNERLVNKNLVPNLLVLGMIRQRYQLE